MVVRVCVVCGVSVVYVYMLCKYYYVSTLCKYSMYVLRLHVHTMYTYTTLTPHTTQMRTTIDRTAT